VAVCEQASQVQSGKLPGKAARNSRWAGFTHLLMARVREMQREPEVIFWVFGFPLLLALGLGIAFRNKPAEVARVAIVSGAAAPDAVRLIQHAPQQASIRTEVVGEWQAMQGFRLGKYDLLIMGDGNGGFRYLYDPDRPESVLSKGEVDDALQAAAGRKNVLATALVASSQPGSRYIDFLIPGLIGMNLMNSGMWGVGFALVDLRQRKLLKRFVATPMRRSDFLLALAGSRLVLMVLEVGLLLALGALVFHMRVQGSLAAIALWGGMGAVAFGAIGLLTACRAQKIETASGLINVVMMPMWIFSGVFFSYERFPAVIHPLIKALPLTALNDALRASILEGTPLWAQGGRLLVLAIWGGVSFALALRWFRWR